MNRSLAAAARGPAGARRADDRAEERKLSQQLGLLSSKPALYVCNVEEAAADKGNAFSDKVKRSRDKEGAVAVVISAKIESEIAVLPAADQKDYLEAVGLAEPGLNRVIRAGYGLLHLVTYFTVGPERGARLDHRGGHAGAAGGGRHPHRLRKRLHPLRDHRLRRLCRRQRRGRRARGRQVPARRQGLCRRRRRRAALPVCQLRRNLAAAAP